MPLSTQESSGSPLCVLTLDFQHAFDRISHRYLFQILHRYDISEWFIERLHALYENGTASVQIKYVTLCTLPAHLRTLEENLPGIRLGRSTRSPLVVAYADDVTVLVTQPGDFAIIHEAVQCYEKSHRSQVQVTDIEGPSHWGWSKPAIALGIESQTKSHSRGSHMESLLQNR